MDEGLVREAVEVLGLMAVGELRLLQTDRPEDLLSVALAARGNRKSVSSPLITSAPKY